MLQRMYAIAQAGGLLGQDRGDANGSVRGRPRVLMVSPRHYEKEIWRCSQIECEDVIGAVDHVELVAPRALSRGEGRLVRKLRSVAQRRAGIRVSFTPNVETIRLDGEYELLCFYAQRSQDLALLDGVPGWRERCARAVCIIDELWVSQLKHDPMIERLAQFDLVAVMFHGSVEPLRAHTGLRCEWLPPAVDTLRFFPGIKPPPRTIDFYAMGRRSEATHRAMAAHAAAHGWTYLFDTIDPQAVRDNLVEHRTQLAELIKRTRYFLVNKAKVDFDAQTQGQEELAFRSFEGAAGGAIMVGHVARAPSVGQLFDWPDAHIHVPYGAPDMAEVIEQLEAEPDRVLRIRRDNVVNSLRRHDWAHRWQRVLALAGLAPSAQLTARLQQLQALADQVEQRGSLDQPVLRVRNAG